MVSDLVVLALGGIEEVGRQKSVLVFTVWCRSSLLPFVFYAFSFLSWFFHIFVAQLVSLPLLPLSVCTHTRWCFVLLAKIQTDKLVVCISVQCGSVVLFSNSRFLICSFPAVENTFCLCFLIVTEINHCRFPTFWISSKFGFCPCQSNSKDIASSFKDWRSNILMLSTDTSSLNRFVKRGRWDTCLVFNKRLLLISMSKTKHNFYLFSLGRTRREAS